jgi:L-ribulokinase
MGAKLGLPAGIPIAIGEMDVHYGAIGCGVDEGTLVKVIGTSTCDCAVVSADKTVADIPGICGIVKGAILPGYYGVEAGQSAVGDIFKWFVEGVCQGDAALHAKLTAEAAALKPGQSGLLALDWNNGNRTILVDQLLTGLLSARRCTPPRRDLPRAHRGHRLRRARHHRAHPRIRRAGRPHRLLRRHRREEPAAHADLRRRHRLRDARLPLVAVLRARLRHRRGGLAGAHPDFPTAQAAMTGLKEVVYRPDPAARRSIRQLYALYRDLHDAFGGVKSADLGHVMKDLLAIKATIR